VVLGLQALGQFPHGGPVERPGKALDVHQQQVLQRRDAVPARDLLAEKRRKRRKPVAKLGQGFEVFLA
jgi:hypothetical protein